jgi:hypothetical protein
VNHTHEPKLIKYGILSAGGLLAASALTHFLIAAENSQALALPDPIIGLPLRTAVLLAGVLETTVALICLFWKQTSIKIVCLAWLATVLSCYRAGLFVMGVHPQGTPIGSLTDPLHLAGTFAGHITTLLPIFFVAGSYFMALWVWVHKRQSRYRRMFCPDCGGHIKFSEGDLGKSNPCPHCKNPIILRRPEDDLRMLCFFCQSHIQFPSHALGRKIKCPHCDKGITLQAFPEIKSAEYENGAHKAVVTLSSDKNK